MSPGIKIKLQNIGLIVLLSLLFGMVYNLLFYPHTLTEFLEAGSISLFIGLVIGLIEEFPLKKVFYRISIYKVLLVRTILYSFFIVVILSIVLSIEISVIEEISYYTALLQYLRSSAFQRDYIFSIAFVFLILFVFQIIQLIGKENFLRLVLGLYHKPREVNRIYMFVDLKDSTAIAEKLDNRKYSNLVKDFIFDISDAIIKFKGEIYQYVGDEIVINWPIKDNNSDCINCFFEMNEIMRKKKTGYLAKYGVQPRFKAGIHAGKVIITEVGKQKKEIVHHGDVLNTTSRIEGKCNELNQPLLISSEAVKFVKLSGDLLIQEQGQINLKGKTKKLGIYAVLPIEDSKNLPADESCYA